MFRFGLKLTAIFILTFIGFTNGFMVSVCILTALIVGFCAGASKEVE